MRIAVTGSIATDYLMTFPGRFTELLVDNRLEHLSLSFLVDGLTVRRGGVAANVAVGLARLGHAPLLVGAVGADFAEYRAYLETEGVDTSSVLVSPTQHSVRFLCTTDLDQNQIASFYPGAMSEARNIELAAVDEAAGGLDLVLVSPNDPDAMVRHTAECRDRGYAFVADPSQQLARLSGEQVRALVEGAEYLFTNSYEHALLGAKSGWSDADVLARVGCWVTTAGESGVRLERAGRPPVEVAALPPERELDPTGVGDGFRAGFVAGLAWGLPEVRACQLGCALATVVLEALGPQEYELDHERFVDRIALAYGHAAAADVGQCLERAGLLHDRRVAGAPGSHQE
jgi:adenosine kinase